MLMNCVEFLEKSKLKDELQISFEVDARYEITFKKLDQVTERGKGN